MATIRVTLSDFSDSVTGAGHFVQLTAPPHSPFEGSTDENGEITFTEVPEGRHTLNIPGSGIPSLRLDVPDSEDTLDAIDLVESWQDWTPPFGNPEGRIRGKPGDQFFDTRGRALYAKTGSGKSGWVSVVTLGS